MLISSFAVQAITIFVLFFILGLIISFSNFPPTYLGSFVTDLILTRFFGILLMTFSALMVYSLLP